MSATSVSAFFDAATETLARRQLEELQLQRVQALFGEILPRNAFHAAKFGQRPRIASWDDFHALPFTTKAEIAEDQLRCPPYGTNVTFPLERYVKLHQTSGTTGKAPIRLLDTEESWDWWARCWGFVLAAAGIRPGDRVFVPFSFGLFVGFWAGFEGARALGALAIPGGGQDSPTRLAAMETLGATVLVCTPSVARASIATRASAVRRGLAPQRVLRGQVRAARQDCVLG